MRTGTESVKKNKKKTESVNPCVSELLSWLKYVLILQFYSKSKAMTCAQSLRVVLREMNSGLFFVSSVTSFVKKPFEFVNFVYMLE